MILLFYASIIFYGLIGFGAIRIKGQSSLLQWNKAIFFLALTGMGLGMICAIFSMGDYLTNLIVLPALVISLTFSLKCFKANLSPFHPIALLDGFYTWFVVCFCLTLLLELLPYGTNSRMMKWGFGAGSVIALVILFKQLASARKSNS